MDNILYISYDGMTDPLGRSQVLPYLMGLSKKGLKFHLISFEKETNYNFKKNDILKLCIENNIEWHPLKYTKRPPVLSTIWDVFKMNKLAKSLQRVNNFKAVHCRSYIPALIGLKLKKKYNLGFIFDMRGFWVDERIEGGIWDLKNPLFKFLYKYFKNKEKLFIVESDQIVCLTDSAKNEIDSWKIKDNLPINVIPCCVDLHLFKHTMTKEDFWREKFNINQKSFTLCYLGSLSTVYQFDKVIQLSKELKKRNKELKLIVITQDSVSYASNIIKNEGLEGNDFITLISLDRNQVPEVLSICDYSIFFYKPTYSRKGTSPTRFAELLACGLKVITNDKIGDTTEIVIANELGSVLPNLDKKTLSSFAESFDFIKKYDKENQVKACISIFDLNIGIQKYFDLYQKII